MFRLLCLSVLVWTLAAFPTLAAKRALVIGNNAYDELPDLRKAIADARAYTQVLTDLGYEVTKSEDLSTLKMQRAIGDFIDRVEPGDEVAFVYAGHGWSDGLTNYIIGGDAEVLTSSASLRRAAIPIENGTNGVIDDLRRQGARIVLAVLDACRTNPFKSKNGRSGSVGLSRGLVLLTPVAGTFTVFSAGAGEEALDRLNDKDNHPNSVFSRVFLEELSAGGNLQDIVLNTAPRVAALATTVGHSQRPSYYDGIGERYCLSANCASGTPLFTPATDAISTPDQPELAVPKEAPTITEKSDEIVAVSPFPNPKPAIELDRITSIPPSDPLLPTPVEEATSTTPEPTEQAFVILPLPSEEDPYFRPDPIQPAIPQPAGKALPTPTGAPVQFIARSGSVIRTVAQLDRESICSVERSPQQATIENFFSRNQFSYNNRQYRNLKKAIEALERSRCSALAIPPRLVADVISTVRDPSRWVVLPEIVR